MRVLGVAVDKEDALKLVPLILALAGWAFNLGSLSTAVSNLEDDQLDRQDVALIAEHEVDEAVAAVRAVQEQQFEEVLRRLDAIDRKIDE
jgi:hypothetical protein